MTDVVVDLTKLTTPQAIVDAITEQTGAKPGYYNLSPNSFDDEGFLRPICFVIKGYFQKDLWADDGAKLAWVTQIVQILLEKQAQDVYFNEFVAPHPTEVLTVRFEKIEAGDKN